MRAHRINHGLLPSQTLNGAAIRNRAQICTPRFVYRFIPNGLTVSTCAYCQRVFASPTLAGLKLAEAVHKCWADYG